MVSNIKTPGVYINEINAFGHSVVPVATAVPAFIGYTPSAEFQGKSYSNKVQKISSFAEFQEIYLTSSSSSVAEPAVPYHPEYYLIEQDAKPNKGDYLQLDGRCYCIVPDPSTIYYLYNSIRLFYQNGGGDAYIVSVGSYGPVSGKAGNVGEQIVNPNVQLADLQRGLALLKNESEPTIYICPEATLLSIDNNGTLMESMLSQANDQQTAVCLFDIIGGNTPDPITYTYDIDTFRNKTGSKGLKYGAVYYPFIGTTIMQSYEMNYSNLFGGDAQQLKRILSPTSAPNRVVETIIDMIDQPSKENPLSISQLNESLLNASAEYAQIINHVLSDANVLPPSGAMAGVYTVNDNEHGVWNAPANTSIVGASSLPIHLTDAQQADLNIDAVSGKSVNAIRFFNGQGILVWGARTLDGNSQDWRYISVRRTMTFLEQSVKLAVAAYAFEDNSANTWEAVKSAISSFLVSIWKEGGLQGASAADAFQVECGLGSTMTADDILNGFMRVFVKVALIRPAEFIILNIEQEMAISS
ncbi:phage tail sheath subtilisin-like domain-containing protein [Marinomonas sp. 15G1-11]|uniref:Phage tail sheath subtilisin-like domain-containing protein n=1 Tax=Marinomonas phaeophyticola TaxID=3004091 RepID=A0ABT4JQ44_9GAMM|nr:phage tail sheath C-terminal domain-containing protein [Marinomonas sp. 15G1-11]MCZ2720507.1 phage tail sheath subtilisin-like domain-containing protein [Marinomonas sp. 15G1-11]